ncbi:helix-turn-helix domain-containing protein [Clostridium saudiense]|uniref:helix-turn-helix domain-containing protein n=1 Tax=Clostridium saudiense TaxID=1414720 RepID=UPI0026702010|nr:helix-turn-helix transcriptional regulator [Clostridium saudiense]MDU7453139.1 helix-turn-helix transcriptional regulator [Clostridium saudiense]
MNEIKDRVKFIRTSKKLSQEEFGKIINLSRSAIAGYETGVREITDRSINDICREFKINENWLRNGEGEMEAKMTSDEEFAFLVGAFAAEGNDFKKRIIKAMLEIENKDDWELIASVVERLAK